MRGIRGIVLAGVHSWDESGFDTILPRPLMPVAHKPLISHILEWMRDVRISRSTICANSASRRARQVLADGTHLGVVLDYYEDWTPRGPAGCIRDAAMLTNAERFVIADGTILPECNLEEILAAHASSGAALTVVDAPVGNQNHRSPVGIYVIDRAVMEHIPVLGYQDVKEILLPLLHKRGVPTRSHTLRGPCPRVTDAASYLALNAWVLEQLVESGTAPPGFRKAGKAIVHATAHVSDRACLLGPVLVGPGTTIAPDATVVGPTAIGVDCVIESGAAVCGTVLWNGCRVGAEAVVNQCVLCDTSVISAETSLFCTVVTSESGRMRRRRERSGTGKSAEAERDQPVVGRERGPRGLRNRRPRRAAARPAAI